MLGSIFSKIDAKNKEIGDIDESSALNGNNKFAALNNLYFMTFVEFQEMTQAFKVIPKLYASNSLILDKDRNAYTFAKFTSLKIKNQILK